MSEFIAEAQVLIRPNTAGFRAALETQLVAASKGLTIPVSIVASGTGLAALTASTGELAAAQTLVKGGVLDLIGDEAILNSTYGKQAVLLTELTAKTTQQAGAQVVLNQSTKHATAGLLGAGTAAGRLDAGLLALRTAVGSTAVIGLGALALAGIAVGKAFRASIVGAAELEQELNFFQATADATTGEMESVSRAARKLGEDATLPAISARDAAEALTDLARAGLSVEDAIGGAKGTLQLSAAAQISVADATNLTANALNTFALAGTEATHVADLLTGASIEAQGEITDMGIALAQSGAAARLAGVSLDDTVALITLLAKSGLKGSDAGTSLRTAFIALANPTEKAKKLIEALNLQVTDLNGNLRPEVFADFAQATAAMGNVARLAAAKVLFGADALRAAGLAGLAGVEGLDQMRSSTSEAGLAAKLAGARTRGFAGDINALQSNLDTLGTTLGGTITPILSSFTRGLNDAITLINKFIDNPIPISATTEQATETLASLDQQIAETQAQIETFRSTGGGIVPPALTDRLAELQEKMVEVSGATHDTNLGMAEFIDRTNKAAAAAAKLSDALAPLGARLQLGIAVAQAGGNQGRELSLLRQVEARQQAFLDSVLGRPQTAKNVALATKAAANLKRTRDQIQTIIDGQIADQKAAAADAKSAAKKAQDARDQQFEALADIFGGRQQNIQDAISRAGIVGNLAKEQRLNQALITALKRERKTLLERLRTLKVSAEVRKRILDAINAAIESAQQDALRFQQEQKKNVEEALNTRLDLKIQLAEAKGNVKAQIRAHQAKLEELRKELKRLIKQHKGNTNAALELKVAIAEEEAAIKDLRKKNEDKNKATASLFFSFLQTQQGFAANLLGNLIPGFATGGLVGGSGGAAGGGGGGSFSGSAGGGVIGSIGDLPGEGRQGPLGPSETARGAAAVAGSRERGVRPVQVDTTNQLLRQILRSLQNLNGRTQHPEARHNRAVGSAILDTMGGVHGA